MTVRENVNGSMKAVYHKFPILTINGSQEFEERNPSDPEHPRKRGTEGRLLVHPDGGKPGRAGYIGIEAGDASKVRSSLLNLRARCGWESWHELNGDYAVPLFVAGDALLQLEGQRLLRDSSYRKVVRSGGQR